MKIIHVLSSNKFSGAENVVCQIIEMFKNESDIQMFYCSPNGEIANILKQNNINYIPLEKMNIRCLKKAIKKVNPDIIHAHDMKASFVASLACGKIELISHIHNNAIESRKLSVKSILYLYAAAKSKRIIWVSNSAFKGYYFGKFFVKKSIVLYNVIDVKKLYEKMTTDTANYYYDVIYLGRLTYPKNPERLIKVISLIQKEKNDIKVAIVGTGDLEEKTKKLVQEYSLTNNVVFLGFQKNPLKML